MAVCKSCYEIFDSLQLKKGKCEACITKETAIVQGYGIDPKKVAAKLEQADNNPAARERERNKAINAVLLTTESNPDIEILKRKEIIGAECIFVLNNFNDILTVSGDFFGGQSDPTKQAFKNARKTALYELQAEAYNIGANAVIAVDFDYSEISKGSKSILFLVATGTAVNISE